ncbi:MAG: nucleotidyltransferase domain-containing protein [Xanthobacteraceae bacterium]|nr:nucleotidyltransferase domain-containing protein [Xanthobacteraceae bacterium]
MPTKIDDPAVAAARAFAEGVAALLKAKSGAGLLGVYLLGSLAHGGFNRRYSDIDLALVMENGIDQATLDAVKADAAALSPELSTKLSIFWSNRQFSIGRFPPLDRVDYLDHAVALIERERVDPPRPALQEIRDYLGGAPFANWAASARHFVGLDTLGSHEQKPYLRALLYPARFIFSWVTGGVASNDEAVAFLREQNVPGLDVDLVAAALQCRQDARDPQHLFAARAVLPRQVEACARLAGLPL